MQEMRGEYCGVPVGFNKEKSHVFCQKCQLVMYPDDVMVVEPTEWQWICLDCADRRCRGPAALAADMVKALVLQG